MTDTDSGRPGRSDPRRGDGLDPKRLVEAALFTAGKPLSKEELAGSTGLTVPEVARAAEALIADYKHGETALEVTWAGQKFSMNLKARYVEHAKSLAEMEIPKKLLKTLALIAYHQPMKQSELVDMIGSKTYEHVGELAEKGLIRARHEGVTKILTTTGAFPEYFGIKGLSREEIRAYLAEKVGLDPNELKREKPLDTFVEGAAASGDEAGPNAAGDDGAHPQEVPTDVVEEAGAPDLAT